MPGVWDNAHGDDVVILVTSKVSLTVRAHHREVDGLPGVASSVRNSATGILAADALRPDGPRAPPTVRALLVAPGEPWRHRRRGRAGPEATHEIANRRVRWLNDSGSQ